jgi:pyrimidine deaminase RibD-like protein
MATPQVRKSVVSFVGYHLLSVTHSAAGSTPADWREEVATMINDTFEVSGAGAVLTAGTSHAAHAAVPAAGAKHRAAATDASVDRRHT